MPLRIEVDESESNVLDAIRIPLLEETIESLWDTLAPGRLKPSVARIDLSVADPRRMSELNETYRGVKGPTDVLAFPLWETEKGVFSPPGGWPELDLGDVVICLEEIARNAQRYGKSFEEELLLVLVHGVLHLFAFDHACEKDRAGMWKVQEDIIETYTKRSARARKEEE